MRSRTTSGAALESALRAFKNYVGVKIHFNDSMVWRRGSPLKLNEATLLKRRDSYLFTRMAETTPDEAEQCEIYVTMFKQNQSAWIGEAFEHETKVAHRNRMAVVNSLSYAFRSDIDRIVDYLSWKNISLKQAFLPDEGLSPPIISDERNIIGGIKDETFALLNKALGFCSRPTLDPLWNNRAFMLSKYQHWLPFDDRKLEEGISQLVACDKRRSARTQSQQGENDVIRTTEEVKW